MKDLESTNVQAKIVRDSTYKSHVTSSSQIVQHTSEFNIVITNHVKKIAEAT
jgi:pyruvate/oxaloacetate carboxyltransferase